MQALSTPVRPDSGAAGLFSPDSSLLEDGKGHATSAKDALFQTLLEKLRSVVPNGPAIEAAEEKNDAADGS